jgi:hypothetical protein
LPAWPQAEGAPKLPVAQCPTRGPHPGHRRDGHGVHIVERSASHSLTSCRRHGAPRGSVTCICATARHEPKSATARAGGRGATSNLKAQAGAHCQCHWHWQNLKRSVLRAIQVIHWQAAVRQCAPCDCACEFTVGSRPGQHSASEGRISGLGACHHGNGGPVRGPTASAIQVRLAGGSAAASESPGLRVSGARS